jgi:hypothetical protein
MKSEASTYVSTEERRGMCRPHQMCCEVQRFASWWLLMGGGRSLCSQTSRRWVSFASRATAFCNFCCLYTPIFQCADRRQDSLFHYFLLEEMDRRRRSIWFDPLASHHKAGVISDCFGAAVRSAGDPRCSTRTAWWSEGRTFAEFYYSSSITCWVQLYNVSGRLLVASSLTPILKFHAIFVDFGNEARLRAFPVASSKATPKQCRIERLGDAVVGCRF